MRNDGVRIIDKTLTVLWNMYREKLVKDISLTRELTRLLSKIGCNCIEITPDIFNKIHPLPMDVEFFINVNKEIYIHSGNDLEDTIKKHVKHDKDMPIRITGLEDLVFYDYREKLLKLKNTFGDNVELEISNKMALGTAIAYEWINLGGNAIVGSFAGVGGYVPVEEILCSLKFIDGRKVNGDTKILPRILEIYEVIMNEKLPTNKPVMGEKIFDVESGIHVDGIMKNPENYEPYSPLEVGRERKIIIGKHSGSRALTYKLEQLNIALEVGKVKTLLEIVKNESIKRHRGLYDNEIYDICKGL